MYDAKTYVSVVVEGFVAGLVNVRGLKRYGLVAILLGYLYPAIPIAVLYICSAEDDEAGFEFLNIDEEGQAAGFFLLLGVYVLCISDS